MAQIKVVAVGSSACQVINKWMEPDLPEVEFIAIDSNAGVENYSYAAVKLHMGWQMMRRFQNPPSLNDPELGLEAALESEYELRAALRDSELVLIASFMGGGTASFAGARIAEYAREAGVKIITAVTCTPFDFEGRRRRDIAQEGLELLMKQVDCLFNISQTRLLPYIDREKTLDEAYAEVGHLLYRAVQGITGMVSRNRILNVKLSEVISALERAGLGLVAFGEGSGPQGMAEAIEKALDSPLLRWPAGEATDILMNITGAGFDLDCLDVVMESLLQTLSPEVNVIYNIALADEPDSQVQIVLFLVNKAQTYFLDDYGPWFKRDLFF